MAISTYTELKAAVDAYLGHGLFTAHVPDFITMAEAAFNRRLRVRQMEESAILTTVDGETTIPDDYLSHRFVRKTGTSFESIPYESPEFLAAAFPAYPSGSARYWTLRESNVFLVYPGEDTDFRLFYYQKIPALSDSQTTNWLLTAHPDLYLFSALCEAELFGVNDTRAALWKTRRDEIMEEIMLLSNRSRAPGTVRVMQATP